MTAAHLSPRASRAAASLASDRGAWLLLVAFGCWLLGHVSALAPIAIPAWVITGLAVGLLRPWYGLLLTVVTIPFLGGAIDLPTGEILRVVPIYGAAVRVLADRFIIAPSFGRVIEHEPPWWVVAAAIAAAGLYALTALTGYLAEGRDPLWWQLGIDQLIGGSIAMMAAWIAAAHLAAGRDRTLALVLLPVTLIACVLALAAWLGIPGVELFTFPARVEGGRLGALGYPTPTAMGLAIVLPFAVVAAYRIKRWLVVPLVGIVLLTMVLTYSRGPLIALGIGAGAGALASGRIDRRVAVAGAVAGALAIAGIVAFRYGTSLDAIAQALNATMGSDGNRVRSWFAAVTVTLANPVLGGGWYALNRIDEFYAVGIANSHNLVLDGFTAGGLPLGITNGVVILYSAGMTWVRRHTMAPYLIASVVVFLVCGFWDIPQVRSYAAVMGGIVLGMAAGPLIERDGPADAGEEMIPSAPIGAPGRARSIT